MEIGEGTGTGFDDEPNRPDGLTIPPPHGKGYP